MEHLAYRCAICAEAIDDRSDDPRVIGSFVLPGREIPMDEYYFHRTCLSASLHASTPRGELFEVD